MRGRIDHLHGDLAVLPLQIAPVVVVRVLAERNAARGAQVILRSGNGLDLARREDVVIVVHFCHIGPREMHAHLGAVLGGQSEAGVPADGDRLRFATYVAGLHRVSRPRPQLM